MIGWGEVWWIESPAFGRRPGLVLTRPEALAALSRLLVAQATTRRRDLPTEVPLDTDDGMPQPCVLNLDTPELVPKSLFIDHITTLSPARMGTVCSALSEAVNCRGLRW